MMRCVDRNLIGDEKKKGGLKVNMLTDKHTDKGSISYVKPIYCFRMMSLKSNFWKLRIIKFIDVIQYEFLRLCSFTPKKMESFFH